MLVSDLGMPEQDGYKLIKDVRVMESVDHTASIPALALTAYAKAEDQVRALAVITKNAAGLDPIGDVWLRA